MTTAAVIPARYGSTRFPGKPLALLGGKPLIAHVIDRAREAARVDQILVATDDERIARAVADHGATAVMTSPDCATGSDRLAEVVASRPDIDIVVNVQGDEPLMPPQVIDRAVEALLADTECAVATAMIRIANEADYLSPHVVKVVCDRENRALYFSRSPLPNLSRATNEEKGGANFWGFKHFGLYIYRREALLQFVRLAPTPLEIMEKLEQLRFLENNYRIRVVETEIDSIGVDTPEDLEAARQRLESRLAKGD